jgi:hypothetical protein
MRKGVKVNFDTAAWHDVAVGDRGSNIKVENTAVK